MSFSAGSLLAATSFKSIGTVAVSTNLVVIAK